MTRRPAARSASSSLRARGIALAPLAALFVATAAYAAWPGAGLPLATGPANQTQPVGLTASGGDLFAFWVEFGAAYPVRAQRVTLQGTLASGWPAGGRAVVTSPAALGRAEIAPDGSGGALLAWYDYRNSGGSRGIYAVRVDESAAVVTKWTPSGAVVCTTFNAEGWGPLGQLLRVCPDGAGGGFVAWTDARNTPPQSTLIYDVFAHHVLADGTLDPAWPAAGLALTSGAGYKYPHELIADDAGGFWLVTENPLATHRLRVTQHAADGAVLGTWVSPAFAQHPDAVSDGAGGVFVTWDDCSGCPSSPDGITVMRLSPGAAPPSAWPITGVSLVASADDEGLPSIVATEDGSAVVAWLVDVPGTNDRYAARRVQASGALAPGWPAGGRTFATSTGGLYGWPLIARDGAGGAMFAFRRNLPNLFGSRVTASGDVPPAFPDTGLALCALTGDQFLATLVSDGLNGAYVLWEDRRDQATNSYDIYVTRFTREGGVGSTLQVDPPVVTPRMALSAPTPNPASGPVTVRLTLPGTMRARVDVLDMAGRLRRVLFDGETPAGTMDLRWDGSDRDGRRLPSGLYLVRAQVRGQQAVRRIVRLE